VLIVLVLLGALGVLATAAIAIGAAVKRTSAEPAPTVLRIDQAVDWIADRLAFEVAAEISHADVKRILLWQLDYFDSIGLASSSRAELGGAAVAVDAADVVAEEDAALDYVLGRVVKARAELTELHVVCVLDLQNEYLRSIGAVGAEADEA
jgi:hypothetical protein